ncbi:MAG: PQQ-dependent sugar dehydrogenase [Dyadobacter sp.]|uniref:PQQ-dependent sugar dehydrogenase n=1 Tax=Dyadobacter sp. TaxID=1914288 RepID=UPI003266A5E5
MKGYCMYACLLVILNATQQFSLAQPTPVIQSFVAGFTRPVRVVNGGDARLFVAEIGGKIRIIKNGSILSQPFLDIGSKINDPDWAGIFSLVFAPNYQTSGYFYVLYVLKNSTEVQLSRFTRSTSDADLAEVSSELKILTIPYENILGGHRGGDLAFGMDGFLYVSTGDNGPGSRGAIGDPGNNSQNMGKLFGKILRLDVNSASPADNILNKIFALGLRNPWRFSFDRSSGDLWIGDNGQDAWEEVNYLKYPFTGTPANFGWNCLEGTQTYNATHCADGTIYSPPKYTYPGFSNNGGSSASVMGGYVYRGSKYPSLKGYYFFGDYQSGKIGLISPAGSGSFPTGLNYESLISFGEDHEGELYTLSFLNGTVSKIANPGDPLPVTLAYFMLNSKDCSQQLDWKTESEINFKAFELQHSTDGKKFERIASIPALGEGHIYHYNDNLPYAETAYYRLKMIDQDGRYQYSKLIRGASHCLENSITIFPNPSSGSFTINGLKSGYVVNVYHVSGRKIFGRKAISEDGLVLDLKGYANGVYTMKVIDQQTGFSQSSQLVKE